jgi:DNA repair exonuclease SbcCD nuclease subunit
MREALQSVLRGLGQQLGQHDGPRLLLGHFMVDGSISSTGQPLLGMPINVGLADLALARAHLTVMGHIHMAQRFELPDAGPAFYTGSPFRTDFGQLEDKSVLYAEFEGSEVVDLMALATPARGMVHVDARWTDTAFYTEAFGGQQPALNPVAHALTRGAEVRFRYDSGMQPRLRYRRTSRRCAVSARTA